MRKFSICFLRPDPVWNLCKLLTPMFTTFILHVNESLGISRDQIVSNKSDLRQCWNAPVIKKNESTISQQ